MKLDAKIEDFVVGLHDASAFARKPESWKQRFPTVTVPRAIHFALPVYTMRDLYGEGPAMPCEDVTLRAPLPQFFILMGEKDTDYFLVDTQGYRYARYVARIGGIR